MQAASAAFAYYGKEKCAAPQEMMFIIDVGGGSLSDLPGCDTRRSWIYCCWTLEQLALF